MQQYAVKMPQLTLNITKVMADKLMVFSGALYIAAVRNGFFVTKLYIARKTLSIVQHAK